ncbi:MAG: glycosyltransferase [Flavobacteriales bacterium]|nr:glycosyltransferase [Flavobacteriales bacterium]
MNGKGLCSIIIPYYNETHLIEGCIYSILQSVQTKRVEVIVVVSNPSIVEPNIDDERVSILRGEKALSYPEAINFGAEKSNGKYLIFSDSDVFVSKSWFTSLIHFFIANESKGVGIASSKLLNPDNDSILDFGIAFSNYNSPHLHRSRRKDTPLTNENQAVQAACSASMMTTREKFHAVSGLNTRLPYSYCDLDLCLRYKSRNWSTWVVADAIAYHQGDSSKIISGTSKSDVKSRFWALNEGNISIDLPDYFKKHFEIFNRSFKLSDSYLLVDVSTVVDRDWYYDIFVSDLGIPINDIYQKGFSTRDASHIPLYGFLGWNVLKLRFPLLFFTDDFSALVPNKLWWEIRPKGKDMIIDRNANFCSSLDIIRNDY